MLMTIVSETIFNLIIKNLRQNILINKKIASKNLKAIIMQIDI